MTREIPLTQGQYAIVDDSDFDYLNQWKWCARKRKQWKHGVTLYDAVRWSGGGYKKGTVLLMHRVIMNPGPEQEVDHIDGNPLNNTRTNLRSVSHSVNVHNQTRWSKDTVGVTLTRSGTWSADFTLNRKNYHIGMYSTREEAATARDDFAKTLLDGAFTKNKLPRVDNPRKRTRADANADIARKKPYRPGKSGYRGVTWHNKSPGWVAQLVLPRNGSKLRIIYLGFFESREEAARAYDQAAKQYFGESAKLNFSE